MIGPYETRAREVRTGQIITTRWSPGRQLEVAVVHHLRHHDPAERRTVVRFDGVTTTGIEVRSGWSVFADEIVIVIEDARPFTFGALTGTDLTLEVPA